MPDRRPSVIGVNVARLRARKGWSRSELAAIVEVAESSVGAVETGRTLKPNYETLRRYADAFGVPVTELTEPRSRPAGIAVALGEHNIVRVEFGQWPDARRFFEWINGPGMDAFQTPDAPTAVPGLDIDPELLVGSDRAQLNHAFAGIKRIAEAAGLFEQTWQDRSIMDVCDRIAAWCARQRGQHPAPAAAPPPPEPGQWQAPDGWDVYVDDFYAAIDSADRSPDGTARARLELAVSERVTSGTGNGGPPCCGTTSQWHRPWCLLGDRQFRHPQSERNPDE